MDTLNLIQGTDAWLDARLTFLCASEAAAMMGESKFMSRGQLLDLKKGWQKNPDSSFKKRLFEKAHEHEDEARELIELEHCENFSPIVGLTKVDGISIALLASFDGFSYESDMPWEHKNWNATLAENVRNEILEPLYYWQLEHQALVCDCIDVMFTCSDGSDENKVDMIYRSIPSRRQKLISGWIQFLFDLENHELKAKQEVIVAREQEAFPIIECRVEGSLVISNLGKYIPVIKNLAEEQMNLVLETDQDFADKESFNKNVKSGRATLKSKANEIETEFESLAEFNDFVKQADTILQKLQSHGENQVKQAKETKKLSIKNKAQAKINEHLSNLSKGINDVQITQIVIDWDAVIKGKRSFKKMEEAVDAELAKAKIEANDIANLIRQNLDSFSELTSDYKFLFSDHVTLLLKNNDDLINLIKTRISDHEEEQKARDQISQENKNQEVVTTVDGAELTKISNNEYVCTKSPMAKSMAEAAPSLAGMDEPQQENEIKRDFREVAIAHWLCQYTNIYDEQANKIASGVMLGLLPYTTVDEE